MLINAQAQSTGHCHTASLRESYKRLGSKRPLCCCDQLENLAEGLSNPPATGLSQSAHVFSTSRVALWQCSSSHSRRISSPSGHRATYAAQGRRGETAATEKRRESRRIGLSPLAPLDGRRCGGCFLLAPLESQATLPADEKQEC